MVTSDVSYSLIVGGHFECQKSMHSERVGKVRKKILESVLSNSREDRYV